jgi:hypothetical protein
MAKGAAQQGSRFRSRHVHYSEAPPAPHIHIDLSSWRGFWSKRLRPFLLPQAVRDLYERLGTQEGAARFADFAHINIGYVSGANDFFHLRPSEADRWRIPKAFLQDSVRSSRHLPPAQVTAADLRRWRREDRQSLLLRLNKDDELPSDVRKLLNSARAKEAAAAYKCRVRDPWYVVPDVKIPDFFLSYMSGRKVAFVRNAARCACTNSLHTVRLKDRNLLPKLLAAQGSPLFQLSCEIEGHPLGGGMLKLEPREAGRVLVPSIETLTSIDHDLVREGTAVLQSLEAR